MSSALVVFSGGQDSTTCLGWAINRYDLANDISYDQETGEALKSGVHVNGAKLVDKVRLTIK